MSASIIRQSQSQAFLSVDIGTSSLKAAFIDFKGCLLAFSRAAYPMGAYAGDWKYAFSRALENLCAQVPDCGIEAVCISGNGPTLVPVGKKGEAMRPLYWYDSETVSPETAFSVEGTLSLFLPHVDRFKRSSPNEYEKTAFFLSSHEWLSFKLGADPYISLPQSAYEPYYWDDGQCGLYGLDGGKFPPFVEMGSIVGKVSVQAARSFGPVSGLKSGTPIVSGAPDFISALIGTRTMEEGDVCDRAGSSEGINYCASERPVVPKAEGERTRGGHAGGNGLRVLPHVRERLWNIGTVIPSSGSLFEQYRSHTGQENRFYEDLLAELITLSPFFYDSSTAPDAALPPPPLPTPYSIPDQGRSVLCAIGFAVRSAIEVMWALGFQVKQMRVSGGQGKSPLWNQMKADMTGVSLIIPEICDGELAGNAVLAAVALGAAPGIEEAAGRMIRFGEVYKPNPEAFSLWEEKYWQYKGVGSGE